MKTVFFGRKKSIRLKNVEIRFAVKNRRKSIEVFLICTLLIFVAGKQTLYAQNNFPVNKNTFRVAIFAPLYLDSIFNGAQLKSQTFIPKFAVAGLDFIQGAEIAFDTLNLGNKHVQAFIYDSKSIKQSIPWLIKNEKLNNIDLIIGSVKQPEYQQLAEFSLQKKIPFISATYPNDGGLRRNPFLIIQNSTLKTHCQAIFSYLVQKHGTDDIYLVKKKNDNRIDNYFREINLVDGKALLKIKTIMLDSSITSNQLRYLIDTTKTSIIIGASLDEFFSQKLADACYPIQKTNRLVLFGMPNWDGFSGWYKADAYTDFPIRYTSPHYVAKYNTFDSYLTNKYLELYRTQPNDMAEKGFEAAYNFTSLLMQHPGDFMKNLSDTLHAPFHNFNFEPVYFTHDRSIPDYYENKRLFIMQIKNGQIDREW